VGRVGTHTADRRASPDAGFGAAAGAARSFAFGRSPKPSARTRDNTRLLARSDEKKPQPRVVGASGLVEPAGISCGSLREPPGHLAACRPLGFARRGTVRRDCSSSPLIPRPRADACSIPSISGSRNAKGHPCGAALCVSIGGAGGNRTRVRKSSTVSSTCVVTSLFSRCRYADAQAQPATSHLFFSSSPSSPARHDPI